MADGAHTLEVIARRADTSVVGSDMRVFWVDNAAPSLEIIEPGSDRLFVEDGPVPFSVRLAPGSGAVRVTLRVELTELITVEPPTRAEVTAEVPVQLILGEDEETTMVILSAEAEDAAGAISEVSMPVTIMRHEQWVANEDAAYHAPLLVPGAVVLGTDDRLVIYDALTGVQRCRVDGPVTSAPLLHVAETNTVWWSTTDAVRAIDIATCTVQGSRASAGDVVTGMIRTPSGIAIVTFAGRLVILGTDFTEAGSSDLAATVTDGGTLEIDGAIGVAPDGTIYVAGSLGAARGGIFAVRAGTGTTYAPLPAAVSGGLLATADGAFVASSDGRLYRVAPDLTRPWRTAPVLSDGAPIECTPVLVAVGVVATCDGDTSVHALSIEDGSVLWTYDASGDTPASRIMGRGGLVAAPGGGRFALGDRLGNIHVLDGTGRLLWRSAVGTTPTGLTPPALDDTTLAVADDAGLLALYGL
jgi:outer membrane protein assembly factor BamB